MRQEGEPSVEEILESIKKVIARDNREAVLSDKRRRETAGVIRSEEAVVQPSIRHHDDEVLDLDELGAALDHEEDDSEDEEAEGLTNSDAAEAMRQSLSALAMLAEPGQPPQIVRSGETSLEGLVREMLRPMLAQWLDTNLPGIVDKLVRAEIARIAGKKR